LCFSNLIAAETVTPFSGCTSERAIGVIRKSIALNSGPLTRTLMSDAANAAD
jgi:hypothetical protein